MRTSYIQYTAKTHVFDTKGNELTDQETVYYTKEGQDYRKEADCIGCACKEKRL